MFLIYFDINKFIMFKIFKFFIYILWFSFYCWNRGFIYLEKNGCGFWVRVYISGYVDVKVLFNRFRLVNFDDIEN